MSVKKKKSNHQLVPPFPKNITRYRKINGTTSFAPSIYTEDNIRSSSPPVDDYSITIVNEQEWSSSQE